MSCGGKEKNKTNSKRRDQRIYVVVHTRLFLQLGAILICRPNFLILSFPLEVIQWVFEGFGHC